MSFNKISILGNLGREVDLRFTQQGKPVASFSMATTEKRGQDKEVTTWFKVTLWGRQAEIASQYLTKGSQVYIEGRVSLEEWTDKDGNKRSSIAVNATDMQFIGGGNRDNQSAGSPASNTEEKFGDLGADENPDDVPF
jgi:single-strand DNA-binding protein